MLTELRISGLALLEDCTLELRAGLTAITGETGAGKTMLLTALRLLTGGRADPKRIKAGRNRIEVDALLEVGPTVANELEEAGFYVESSSLGAEDGPGNGDGPGSEEGRSSEGETAAAPVITLGGAEIAFSRTVLPSRSKAAIGGRPVPARMLQETAGQLISIHGQADQWRLKSPAHQRELLDSYAAEPHSDLIRAYSALWDQTKTLREKATRLEENKDRLEVELRYLKEVTSEVDALELSADEEDILDAAIDRLANVEELRRAASSALTSLAGPEDADVFAGGHAGALDNLGMAAESLTRAVDLDPDVADYAERARALDVEASALASDIRDYVAVLFDDPYELARLHDRRAALTDLCRGRARNAEELLEWVADAKERIAELEGESADPQAARRALEQSEKDLADAAARLHESRVQAGRTLCSAVNAELAELALAHAELIVEVEPARPSPTGFDKVEMLLRPHPSAPATPLGEGASGGELSRIMLALEVVLASNEEPQTMVFDEVDAGIGGLTANQVGRRLKKLARHHQVLVVTHLPQVAALADANFVVEKVDGNASVRALDEEERTDEIVRMLGGDDGEGAARRHALELQSQNDVKESNS